MGWTSSKSSSQILIPFKCATQAIAIYHTIPGSIEGTEETEKKKDHLGPNWTPISVHVIMGSEKSNNLPKITKLVRGRGAFRTQQGWTGELVSLHHPICCPYEQR